MRSLDGTLVGLVRACALEQPDRAAYIFLDAGGAELGQMTYAQLDLRVRAIAAQLQDHVAAGDRVLLLFTPSLEFMSAFHACLYAGEIPVPCYPAQTPQDAGKLAAIAGNAGTKVVLCDDPVLARGKPMLAAAPKPLSEVTWLSVTNIADSSASHWREPALTSESLALLQYTSGSTGVPNVVKQRQPGRDGGGVAFVTERLGHWWAGGRQLGRCPRWAPVGRPRSRVLQRPRDELHQLGDAHVREPRVRDVRFQPEHVVAGDSNAR